MKKLPLLLSYLIIQISLQGCANSPYSSRHPAGLIRECQDYIASFFSDSYGNKTSHTSDPRAYVTGNHENKTFVVGRGLGQYKQAFSKKFYPQLSFEADLNKIKFNSKAHWLDVGGGEGRATEQALSDDAKFHSTLVSVESNAKDIYDSEGGVRRKVLTGRFIEDIPDEELPPSDIITDLYGAAAYGRFDAVFKKSLSRLKNKESIYYLYLGDQLDLFGDFNKVLTKNGEVLSIIQWLKNIQGIDVEIVEIKNLVPDSDLVQGTITKIAKIKRLRPIEDIRIPEFTMISFEQGSPQKGHIVPRMIFKEVDAYPSAPPLPTFSALKNSVSNLISDYRTGEFDHPLLDALEALNNKKWAFFSNDKFDLSGLDGVILKDNFYLDLSTQRLMNRFKKVRAKTPHSPTMSFSDLPHDQSLQLIIDNNGTLFSLETPDKTLKAMIDSINDKGTLIIYLGRESASLSSAPILIHDQIPTTIKSWLKDLKGLEVSFKRSKKIIKTKQQKVLSFTDVNFQTGQNITEVETEGLEVLEFATIRIKNRRDFRPTPLKYLGKSRKTPEGLEIPMYMKKDLDKEE